MSRKTEKTIAALLCLVVLLSNTACVGRKNESDYHSDKPEGGSGIEDIIDENKNVETAFEYRGKKYGFSPDISSYLVMGIDEEGELKAFDNNIGTGQCDSIYLVAMNQKAKSCSILQLNRDTMTEMNILGVHGDVVGSEVQQLCLAHAYGDGEILSCKNAADAVSKLLKNVPITAFAALNFDALAIINDDLGGVDLRISEDLTAVDPALKKGKKVHLDGDLAMKFVRARMSVSDGSNVSRMGRQRDYLSAMMQKLKIALKKDGKIADRIYDHVLPYMCSDLSLAEISNLALKLADYSFKGIFTIDGKVEDVLEDNGKVYAQFFPDEDSLTQTVIDLFCMKTN